MKIVADGVSKGSGGTPLPLTTVEFETGRVTVVEAETGDRPVVLALILSGRMRPDSGTVTLDGVDDPALLRERIALVDAPEVSEPPADLPLAVALRDELLYAGRPTGRASVAQTLADAGGTDFARTAVGEVPPAVRLRLLTELAAFRRGVQGIVLTSPDRHGGDPREWLAIADDLAARDFAVAVVCGAASAEIVRPLLPAMHEPSTPERTAAASAHTDPTPEEAR